MTKFADTIFWVACINRKIISCFILPGYSHLFHLGWHFAFMVSTYMFTGFPFIDGLVTQGTFPHGGVTRIRCKESVSNRLVINIKILFCHSWFSFLVRNSLLVLFIYVPILVLQQVYFKLELQFPSKTLFELGYWKSSAIVVFPRWLLFDSVFVYV